MAQLRDAADSARTDFQRATSNLRLKPGCTSHVHKSACAASTIETRAPSNHARSIGPHAIEHVYATMHEPGIGGWDYAFFRIVRPRWPAR